MTVRCAYCGYKGKEGEFLEMECPACCRDLFTGEVNEDSIPRVFHEPDPPTFRIMKRKRRKIKL